MIGVSETYAYFVVKPSLTSPPKIGGHVIFLLVIFFVSQNDHTFMKSSFNIVREYLYWCFRKTFLMVVITESVIFLLWCWGFALVYFLIGRFNPTCIQTPSGYNFEEADMGFIDVFTLSWNTFSTVVSECDY